MEKLEELRLKLIIARLVKMGILQSAALMKLSTAMMRIEGISTEVHEEAHDVFSGIQEQLDLLMQIQDMDFVDEV